MGHNAPFLFLSYASPDQERILPYYDWLRHEGLNAWIDCRNILPGQKWDPEILRAINSAALALVFISANSKGRRGYLQKEVKLLANRASILLDDDVFIVPVLLDDVPTPRALARYQAIKIFQPDSKQRILETVHFQLKRLAAAEISAIDNQQNLNELTWGHRQEFEEWDGLPGYRIDSQLIELSSIRFKNIHEINQYTQATIQDTVRTLRECKLEQDSESYNFAQDYFLRTNTMDARCSHPTAKGKMLSLQYIIGSYGAGAAHPNFYYKTFVYLLEPLTRIQSLDYLFSEPADALALIQTHVRLQLARTLGNDDDETAINEEWLNEGTQTWANLENVSFTDSGLEVSFAPYAVAPYVMGSPSATIDYEVIFKLLKPTFRSAFGIEHLEFKLREHKLTT
jgi:hypothetical protein